MSVFWLGRSSRRTQVADVRPGNRYRRHLGGHLAATATVLGLRSDLAGIPHVQFAVTVDGSENLSRIKPRRLFDSDPIVAETFASLITINFRDCAQYRLNHSEPAYAANACIVVALLNISICIRTKRVAGGSVSLSRKRMPAFAFTVRISPESR